jgi:hypothetical protein
MMRYSTPSYLISVPGAGVFPDDRPVADGNSDDVRPGDEAVNQFFVFKSLDEQVGT